MHPNVPEQQPLQNMANCQPSNGEDSIDAFFMDCEILDTIEIVVNLRIHLP